LGNNIVDGWLLVLKGYFDETFDEFSKTVWIGGHVGDQQAWTRYVNDWRLALGQRQQIHMRRLRWKKKSEQDLLARLGPIPAQSGLTPLVRGIHRPDIADLIAGTPLERYFDGYVFALMDVLMRAILRVPDNEQLEVVFEDRDQTREHAQDAAFAIRAMGYLSGAEPGFCNSDGTLKLARSEFMQKAGTVVFDQADYLCYAVLQRHRDAASQKALWCDPILKASPITDEIMSRETAREVIRLRLLP
jgi:hypothetical protein